MSALAKFKAVAGIDAASRVKRFQNALAASDTRRARLDEVLEAAVASFKDTADVAARTAAKDAVAAEQKARADIVEGLAEAQKELDAEEAEKVEQLRQERHARLRKEATAFGGAIGEDLVTVGKKISSFESLVDQLPSSERYRFWIPTIAEEASKELTKDRATTTRSITFTLLVPITKATD